MEPVKETSWRTVQRLLPYLLRYKRRVALAGLGTAFGILLQLPLPLLTMYIIDHLISREMLHLVTWISLGLIGILLVRSGASLIERYYLNTFRLRVVYDLKRETYEHLLRLPLDYCYKKQTGYLISRISGDIEGVQGLFAETFLQIVRSVLTFLVGAVAIFWLNSKLALITTVLLPFYAFSLLSFNKRIRDLVEENREAYAHLFKYLQEHISGIAVLKAFVAERHDTLGMLNLLKEAIRKEFKSGMLGTLAMLASGLISSLGPIILLWLGIIEIVNGRLTLGGLVAFNSFLMYLFSPLSSISGINVTVQNSLACARRVFEFFDQQPEFAASRHIDIRPGARMSGGEIEFRQVRFAYPSTAVDVLRDISFVAPAGRVTAIVGRSGVGKSSIVNLLMRFYESPRGTILVDGQDIRQFDPAYYRRNIGLVTQEPFLFGYSIMENIKLGDPRAGDEAAIAAAKAAYAHDFILALPEQYQTRVGERGALISGGQRQRITIARVFLKNPRIVVLDEATSSLDSQSEQYVREAMERLLVGRTVVVISHRLSTIMNADKIIVLDEGKIADVGDHATLYATSDLYRGLYNEQNADRTSAVL